MSTEGDRVDGPGERCKAHTHKVAGAHEGRLGRSSELAGAMPYLRPPNQWWAGFP
jgi:hypothetical protein